MKHTKGTWFLSGGTELVAMPSQMKIARIDYVGSCEETEANAHLLEAAPDLLEVAELALVGIELSAEIETLEQQGFITRADKESKRLRLIKDKIRNAIKKAKQ